MTSKRLLQEKTALGNRYYDLFQSQKFVDCSFIIDDTKIKCHKLILSAASPVFEAMFYGPMSEKQSVEILDINPEIFLLMIEYIYTNEVEFEKESIESLIELYYSAEKYMLSDLTARCLVAIQRKLRFQNILSTIDLSFYMDLQPLMQVCITFFNKCCLAGCQFLNQLKTNYYHLNKESLKLLIKWGTPSKQLNCFLLEWCDNERKRLGLCKNAYKIVFNDLELAEMLQLDKIITELDDNKSDTAIPAHLINECSHIERVYYKACRPFTINENQFRFSITLKADRFISLLGVVIHSRLMPSRFATDYCQDHAYNETIGIEIQSEGEIIYTGRIADQRTNYNCDVNIMLDRNVIMSASQDYLVKLMWGSEALGSEYFCSIQSNVANGVTFSDHCNSLDHNGSIVKGIKCINLS